MIGTTAAILGSAAISAGAGLFGASKQAGAAKSAAQIQSDAATHAGELTQNAANTGIGDITTSMDTSSKILEGNKDQANDILKQIYGSYLPQIAPYQQAGQGALSGLQQLAGGQMQFGSSDPSYQFRLQEGQKALERGAAARGGALGGAAVKQAMRYGQDYASTEYGKEYERRFGALQSLLGAGQNANQQALQAGTWYGGLTSGNIMDAARGGAAINMGGGQEIANLRMRGAEGYGNALTSGAAANAAGQVGSANAWAQGLSGVGNAAQSSVLLSLLAGGGKTPNAPNNGDPYSPGGGYNWLP